MTTMIRSLVITILCLAGAHSTATASAAGNSLLVIGPSELPLQVLLQVIGSDDATVDSSPLDDDSDGVSNDADQCPNTPVGSAVDVVGCAESEKDDDNDGISNDADQCPNTPVGSAVDAVGCAESEKDDDNDGVSNDADQCPNTPVGSAVDAVGCAESEKDDDNDGVSNDTDQCPNTPVGATVDANGCAESQKDDDNDGVSNDADQCPNTPAGATVDANGCADSQKDDDGDGVSNDSDQCPNTEPGVEVDSTGCPDATASVEQVYTDSIDALIIGGGCTSSGCHGRSGAPGGLVLRNNATTSNYTSLVNYINNRGGTRLLNKIAGISHGGGQRYSSSSSQYAAIEAWVRSVEALP